MQTEQQHMYVRQSLITAKKSKTTAAMHLKCMAVLHLKTVVPNDNHSCLAVRLFRTENWLAP